MQNDIYTMCPKLTEAKVRELRSAVRVLMQVAGVDPHTPNLQGWALHMQVALGTLPKATIEHIEILLLQLRQETQPIIRPSVFTEHPTMAWRATGWANDCGAYPAPRTEDGK